MAVKVYSKEALAPDYRTMVLEFENVPFDLQKQRELIYEYGVEDDEITKMADKFLLIDLDHFLKNSPKWHGFKIEDDPNQPLEKWWWHLNKIAKGEFPVEKLPEHLRDIYREMYLR
ncbi:MAG: hypothetical protein GXO18_04620 [Aquificae bacterium]|nr:hypothetical protein [Aquificota bacterium]